MLAYFMEQSCLQVKSMWQGGLWFIKVKLISLIFACYIQENYSEMQLGILQSRTQEVRDDQESDCEQLEENEDEVSSSLYWYHPELIPVLSTSNWDVTRVSYIQMYAMYFGCLPISSEQFEVVFYMYVKEI